MCYSNSISTWTLFRLNYTSKLNINHTVKVSCINLQNLLFLVKHSCPYNKKDRATAKEEGWKSQRGVKIGSVSKQSPKTIKWHAFFKTQIVGLLCYIKGIIFLAVTKIKQERTKIDHFFDFLLNVSIFLLEILNIASQLSCEAMLKNLSYNIEKCRKRSWSYLDEKGPRLVLSSFFS